MIGYSPFFSLLAALIVTLWLSGCTQESSQIYSTEKSGVDPVGQDHQQRERHQELLEQLGVQNVPFVPVSSNPIAIELASPQYSDGELRVSLQASVTSREGGVREVRWQQIYGPEAVIVDPYSAETSVWLPRVTQPARLGFRFAAVCWLIWL